MDNPLQFLVLTPYGTNEWNTTPVYASTAEFPLVFPTGPVGMASMNLGFKLVSQPSRNLALLAEPSVMVDDDGFWHPSENGGRKFWRMWWETRALRGLTPGPDPFELSSQRSPKAQAFGGQRTVDIEDPSFHWAASDLGPATPLPDKPSPVSVLPPAPPLVSVLEPTVASSATYDVQVFWQPSDNDAWEASVKLRVEDEMPEFTLGEVGKFRSMLVLTQKGFEKVKALNAPNRFNEGMTPPFSLDSAVTTSIVEAWRNPPAPPKPLLSWETGVETLRSLVVGSYQVLSEKQKQEIGLLFDDFRHFSAIKARYPTLAYFMVLSTMQRTLDSILG